MKPLRIQDNRDIIVTVCTAEIFLAKNVAEECSIYVYV